jgi:hypothetical protein
MGALRSFSIRQGDYMLPRPASRQDMNSPEFTELALWQQTIWYNRSWVTTLKSTIDGLSAGS